MNELRRHDAERGLALIAVLVAFGVLIALTAPFLLSMGHGEAAARAVAAEKEAEWASLSARALLLHRAAEGHAAVDPTPLADGEDEFMTTLEVPEALAALGERGRTLLGGESWDLQRKLDLESMTPLVFGNLLGLATRLSKEHDPDVVALEVDDASRFPPRGMLVVGREVVAYDNLSGNSFGGLSRGQLVEFGFRPFVEGEGVTLPVGSLVLDLRTVLAVAWPYLADGDPATRTPYPTVRALGGLGARLGIEGFSPEELDTIEGLCAVGGLREHGTTWGKPERVFAIREDELRRPRILQVRSAATMAGGSLVRLRSLSTGQVEHSVVWVTANGRSAQGDINMQKPTYVHLLQPLTFPFDPIDTVVEPLVPRPINVNTAPVEAIAAVFANLRRMPQAVQAAGHGESPPDQPVLRPGRAREIAERIVALRTPVEDPVAAGLGPDDETRPFDGWEDLARRVFEPMFDEGMDRDDRALLMLAYSVLQVGRPHGVDMGTVPICFASGPVVGYRAAAARTLVSGREVARLERSGTAIVAPGETLLWGSTSQALLEEYTRLDRRIPYWLTYPTNTGAIAPGDVATIPSLRGPAHILPFAYPEFGFGQPRFPDPDGAASGARAQTALTPLFYPGNGRYAHESMLTSQDPDGRDVEVEGRYRIHNHGLRAGGADGAPSRDHSRISFRLTDGIAGTGNTGGGGSGGMTSRHAISFWFKLRELRPQTIYDLALPEESEPLRNRISLHLYTDTPRGDLLSFEVYDEAGQDPEPSAREPATTPERTAGTWEVLLNDLELRAEEWYHVSLSATGNAPSQLTMLVDGVPRGRAIGRTYLTGQIGPWVPRDDSGHFTEDVQRFLSIPVESVEGFPQQGVLRIGRELFEYSSIEGNAFRCRYRDSVGMRAARTYVHEFRPDYTTLDPDDEIREMYEPETEGVAFEHPVGAAVELYGYSIPVWPTHVIQPGAGELTADLGAFSIARVVTRTGTVIEGSFTFQGTPVTLRFGTGYDEDSTEDIELGDPISQDLAAARQNQTEEILAGFPISGGFGLLIQQAWDDDNGKKFGGAEVFRYRARQGNKLTGIERGPQVVSRLPGLGLKDNDTFTSGTGRNFVTEWVPLFSNGKPVDFNVLPLHFVYAVPISIPVAGIDSVNDLDRRSEWVQIYPEDREQDTEWVRYDAVVDGNLVRAEQRSWTRVVSWLRLGGTRLFQATGPNSLEPIGEIEDELEPWNKFVPAQSGGTHIGWVEPIETQFPAIYVARAALAFRGDMFPDCFDGSVIHESMWESPRPGTIRTDVTSSHAHTRGTTVLPVHRFEFHWRHYGLSAARAGRGDRVALVSGSSREGGGLPAVEWHTVNWAARYHLSDPDDYDDDQRRIGRPGTGNDRTIGQWPFQLVAFQRQVEHAFFGVGDLPPDGGSLNPRLLRDVRGLDRIVKFPSGELPVADVEEAVLGGNVHGDLRDMSGLIDEVDVVARAAHPRLLDQPINAGENELIVRPGVVRTPAGDLVRIVPAEWPSFGNADDFPEAGGLVRVDDELIAYSDYDRSSGTMTIAVDGRGMLGTVPRAHDAGAEVHFLEQVPAAILGAGVNPFDERIEVQSLGGLPRDGGTVLMGREVVHYAWTRGDHALEMPAWRDPEQPGERPRGLLRGRYGTDPASASAGTAVVWWPTRYWDRYRPRADDPEFAYFQTTLEQGPVWFDRFGWEAEEVDPRVQLRCYLRVDGRGTFADDPDETDGLFLLDRGVDGELPPRIAYQGSRLEVRFVTRYLPGAFDSLQYRAQAWKQSPLLKAFVLRYEGEGRILEERITAR